MGTEQDKWMIESSSGICGDKNLLKLVNYEAMQITSERSCP